MLPVSEKQQLLVLVVVTLQEFFFKFKRYFKNAQVLLLCEIDML